MADVWAFGLLLYEIYVGVEDKDFPVPLDEDELRDLAKDGKMVPTPLPAGCPAMVLSICTLCFEQGPARRGTVQQLLEVVNEWLAKEHKKR